MNSPAPIEIRLTAVIFAAEGARARVLVARDAPGAPAALPFGPFDPEGHRTFELALRAFVREQTGFALGYVEQLYTFGDRGREAPRSAPDEAPPTRVLSIGYLALAPAPLDAPSGVWEDWYDIFPWEDWRAGRPRLIQDMVAPRLRVWADEAEGQGRRDGRWDRARLAFGLDAAAWNEERTLDRYELLYEAGLAVEAARDAGLAQPSSSPTDGLMAGLGRRMAWDHRRILATAIQRLRGKLKYRPVLFELMPEAFTLSALQNTAEALLGVRLHKQNFRRALASSGLVRGTGRMETATGGRPAELYAFRREVLRERPTLGVAAPRLRDL